MDKLEYLSLLNDKLSSLPKKEREAALKYYNDLFSDAGMMNEQAVISSLGSPKALAHTILNDRNGISYELGRTKKEVKAVRNRMTSNQSYAALAIIILTFPVWGAILLSIFVLMGAVFAIVVLFLSACILSGAAFMCMGVAYINKHISIFLGLFGTGVALISLAIMLFSPAIHFAVFFVKFIIKNLVKLLNKILGKTEAASR